MIRSGWSSAQADTRARVLLKIDEGWTAPRVAAAMEVTERTAFRINRRFAEEGPEEALRRRAKSTGTGRWTSGWRLT